MEPQRSILPALAKWRLLFTAIKNTEKTGTWKSAKKVKQPTIELPSSSKVQSYRNSFDSIPSNSPPYTYIRDAVRKKAEPQRVPGQVCDCCASFYESYFQEDAPQMIEKLSKHWDKYPIRSTTPDSGNQLSRHPTMSKSSTHHHRRFLLHVG